MRCCTLTWGTKILMQAMSNVHAGRIWPAGCRFPTPVLQHVSIFCPLAGSAEMSPLDFTGTVNSKLECFLTWLQLRPLSFLSRLLFYVFWNHLDKLYICKGDDPLSSFHVYLLISSIGLPYFHRKKGEQFTTVTYLSVLSTLNKSNIN